MFGEKFIKICMLKAWEEVLGKQAVKNMKDILMSAKTIKRRIEEMAEDIEDYSNGGKITILLNSTWRINGHKW